MTEMQFLYARAVVEGKKPGEAARIAGYKFPHQDAAKLQRNDKVTAWIKKQLGYQEKRLGYSVDRWVATLIDMAEVSADELFNDEGEIKKLSQMTERARRLIQSISTTDGEKSSSQSMKTASREKALELLAKHFGYDRQVEAESGVSIILANHSLESEAKDETPNKIVIKVNNGNCDS
jgi:hypothetical protein